MDDAFIFNHSAGTITREERDAPIKCFSYQMPVVFDYQKKHMLTVDYRTKKVILFKENKQFQQVRDNLD